jgi:hypothetical protein
MSPYAPLPSCRHPHCPNRSDCPIHARPTTPRTKGYDHVWRTWRARTIEQHDLHVCGDRPASAPKTTDSVCQQRGLQVPGKVLDHIERIDGPDDPRRLDARNVQLLCDQCHNRKRGREAQEPIPASQKSLWVRAERPRLSAFGASAFKSSEVGPTWG